MSIAELIEILSKMNQGMEVYIYDGEYESYNPINSVENKTLDNETIIVLY